MSGHPASAGAAGFDIVLVDDDATSHVFVERQLRRCARTLTPFSDPEQAWQALHDVPVRVLIVDSRMPGMNGADLLERLAGNGALRAERAWLCSAVAVSAADAARMAAIGVTTITKGALFDRHGFLDSITDPA